MSAPTIIVIIVLALMALACVSSIPADGVTNILTSIFVPAAAHAEGDQPATQMDPGMAGVVLYQCGQDQPVQEKKIAELSAILRFSNVVMVPAGCTANVLAGENYHAKQDPQPDGQLMISIWPGQQ